MIKRIPLYVKILAGLAIGIFVGIIAVITNSGGFIIDYVKPFGTIFLNLLKLIAIPLIFTSLVSGIAGLSNIKKFSTLGVQTFVLYIVTTVIAVCIGLGLVNLIRPGDYFSEGKRSEMMAKYGQSISIDEKNVQNLGHRSPLQFLVDMVPENIVDAASSNTSMLQIIVFAVLFGLALISINEQFSEPVKKFIVGLNEVILKIVDFIMLIAPIGVLALMAGLIVDVIGKDAAEGIQLFVSLGLYFLTVLVGIFIIIILIYPSILRIFVKVSFRQFYKAIFPAQLVAFSTSSSAATLPVTMEQVEKELGIDREITSFVLPLGVTINMDGTSLYQAIASVFIAQVMGIDLSLSQMLTVLIMAVMASIGSAGVPGAGMVMLIVILNSIGIPAEGLALIIAIDRPLDMFRTVVNVTGDAMIATLLGKNRKIT
ncbi:MAG TPA: dicarboxylate/amino acid:cation symporter [Bacteroidales bacterium]|jgi:Na+/H+-dicarboxylate symporter|nr:dicarboxylate/amino acid:cation symporter [Bacteroidales bacterium]MDI9573627.1 dicarboxylate/amino acid:cation symporter [Bacteroidota bacterium]MBP9511043.1 dicarboxylate/amino acid:cation symporter [Bacteroidales bacterium]MBP9588148.1 dicarboxylate/amino acid:cation symporter [Bacteroidales bacterium]NMD15606.1 dicarboxylate/amino acid:cation symporter [Bacteroidales bacterium]